MPPKAQWIAFLGLTQRECIRFLRIWPQTLIPAVVTSLLYFLIFGKVMGERIGSMSGYPYLTFIAPGLMMLAIINNAYSNVMSSVYGSRFSRAIEEVLVSPMPVYIIIAGFTCGGLLRGLLVGAFVFILSLFFTALPLIHPFLMLLLLVLCSILCSLAGFLNGIFARNFDDLTIVSSFILTPLIYLGGVFYNVQDLNGFWYGVSLLNPLHYLIDLFRYALLGSTNPTPVGLALGIIFVAIIVLYVLSHYCLIKGIRLKQ